MIIVRGAALVALAFSLAGCATAIEGTTQPIYVNTVPVDGATCTLSNKSGQWSVITPGSVTVKKSETVLSAHCVKDGWQEGKAYLESRMSKTALFGVMLPYAGLLNAAVDGSSGAGSDYPNTVTVTMKQNPAAAPGPTSDASTERKPTS